MARVYERQPSSDGSWRRRIGTANGGRGVGFAWSSRCPSTRYNRQSISISRMPIMPPPGSGRNAMEDASRGTRVVLAGPFADAEISDACSEVIWDSEVVRGLTRFHRSIILQTSSVKREPAIRVHASRT